MDQDISHIPSIGNDRLAQLREVHRQLHQQIDTLMENPFGNQLLLRRLKREKLQVKDAIQRLRSQLIPDLDA
ncbi:MAG: hypothetical protein RL336_311 [Pseudomonadota bacterium]